MSKKQKPLMECRTFNEVCKQPRDNIGCANFSISSDSYSVVLSEQKIGEPAKQSIDIPKGIFDRLIRWYTTGRMNRTSKRRPR